MPGQDEQVGDHLDPEGSWFMPSPPMTEAARAVLTIAHAASQSRRWHQQVVLGYRASTAWVGQRRRGRVDARKYSASYRRNGSTDRESSLGRVTVLPCHGEVRPALMARWTSYNPSSKHTRPSRTAHPCTSIVRAGDAQR